MRILVTFNLPVTQRMLVRDKVEGFCPLVTILQVVLPGKFNLLDQRCTDMLGRHHTLFIVDETYAEARKRAQVYADAAHARITRIEEIR